MGRNKPLARAADWMAHGLGLPSRPGQEHLQSLLAHCLEAGLSRLSFAVSSEALLPEAGY